MNQQIMNLFDEVCFDLIKTYFRLRIKLEKKKIVAHFCSEKKVKIYRFRIWSFIWWSSYCPVIFVTFNLIKHQNFLVTLIKYVKNLVQRCCYKSRTKTKNSSRKWGKSENKSLEGYWTYSKENHDITNLCMFSDFSLNVLWKQFFVSDHYSTLLYLTGKSFSEALILASTNPQYDKRLFIELPVQHMKTTSAEHGKKVEVGTVLRLKIVVSK